MYISRHAHVVPSCFALARAHRSFIFLSCIPSRPLPLPPTSHDMLKSATDRMKSWVMVSPQSSDPFVKLPNERILYRSPIRTSLTLSSPPNTHSSTQPWSVSSDGGVAFITNQRVSPPPLLPSPR